MVSNKEFFELCSELRKENLTWTDVAKKLLEEYGIAYTPETLKSKYCKLKKKSLDSMDEYKESSESSVIYKGDTVEASTFFDREITNMTSDEILSYLGYNPSKWELTSLKLKTWDQATKSGPNHLYSARYVVRPKKGLDFYESIDVAKQVFSDADIPVAEIEVCEPSGFNDKTLLINQIEMHLGKISECIETGVEFNTHIAVERFNKIIEEVLKYQQENKCGKALVVIGGDFFNSEPNGRTYNGTEIQNDHRYKYLFNQGIKCYKKMLDALVKVVPTVEVMLCEGNHARSMEFFLYEVLKMHYCMTPTISFYDDYKATQVRIVGNSAIFFNHGDCDMKRLIASLPGEFPAEWGSTYNHYLMVGHFHKSEVSNTDNGLQWHRIPAPCSNDNWTTMNRFGMGTRPSYQLMIFDDGLESSRFIYFDENHEA